MTTPFATRIEAYALAEATRQNGYTTDWNALARRAELALAPLDREMVRTARQYAAETAIRTAADRAMGYVSFAGVSA